MPPVVAVVGHSKTGKTRVATALVKNLTRAGYGVVAIKHCHHGHEMDREGSDTDQLFRAGARSVVASSPDKISRVERRDYDTPLENILASVDSGADIVIVEGYKDSPNPKILVADNGNLPFQPDNLSAIVGGPGIEADVPTFGFDQIDGLSEFVRSEFIDAPAPKIEISLEVDGEPVSLKDYPTSALAGVVEGFVSSLKGVPESPKSIRINVSLSE
ncbi:MAG: molybdopterin-guanine dinucleotide biosynthesis protein B [SAR202 cluster bacterium]|jgi:molybdopterin-guanine dinucleotide biosynthesis protein MobB|nr:molybdopterin-guanine dinucleotide biosynthesis protein B [SAR202 cluster bacterium]MDP6511637.1 molybdopterin-guanine dinucleotide biosynthesis protein B [SAR202 cluster bacterium]MDP6715050.1 molybdopterin-guanine dinucleotide biosynthesis protein B [SAR202 cluster bacterium]